MCVRLSFCVYHIYVNAHINQKILDPLKLNLQAAVSLLMELLIVEHRSSARVPSTLKHCAISLVLSLAYSYGKEVF